MVDNKIIDKLFEIGFSENEAKAYISLLTNNPMTAYEIAKDSMISTAKIYEVIAKLLEKKVVIEIEENEKHKLVPVPPEELLDSYKSRFEKTISELKENLKNIKKENDLSIIWNINDYQYLINKVIRIIDSAKKTLLISAWPDEIKQIESYLKTAHDNKIKISIVHFGKTSLNTGMIFKHPIEDTIYNEKGGRGLVIVADSVEVLIGTFFSDGKVEGAISKNRGFVTMAEDYIKHDIYIMKVVNRFDGLLIEKFGENYKKLRDVFNDEEEL